MGHFRKLMIGGLLLLICTAMVLARPDDDDVSSLTLTEAQSQWLEAHPDIRLGPYSNYAPAQFVDEKGVHRGIAADYVALVEDMLGITFSNVYTETWEELIDRSKAREIDVIAMIAETEERLTYLSFTAPYIELPAVIIARHNLERQLKPEDLAGRRVCVVAEYAAQGYLERAYPDISLVPVPDTRTGLRQVSAGESYAFVSDLAVASHFIEEEGITNLRVVGESGYVYRMGFAVRNDWPELTAMIEQALQQVTEEQEREIFNRWISLSHETEFASRRLMTILIAIVSSVAAAAIVFLVWNRTLQKRVNRKTHELNEELAERGRVTEALQASEERIRLIINSALDAVMTMDANGNVTGWTKQAELMFGWSREDMLGKSLSDHIIPHRHREAHSAGLKHYHKTGEGPVLEKRFEITALHKEGHEFPIELAIAPIPKRDSVEFSAFVRDITERQKNEEELRMHREELERLVVMRTAELRTAKEKAEHAEIQLAERVEELEQVLAEVKQLRGLLPICSYCKRIREGEDYSRSVEAYLADHSEATFSHGICPDCYKKHVEPEIEQL